MDSFEISTCLLHHILYKKKHQYAVPNLMFGSSESDVISISKSGYMHEFEIKISKSDYKADKKKSKWRLYKESIESGKKRSRYWDVPNYFWYVFPEGLIEDSEIDDKFGILHIIQDPKYKSILQIKSVREPKRFGNSKVNRRILDQILRSLSFKVLNQQEHTLRVRYNNDELQKKNSRLERLRKFTAIRLWLSRFPRYFTQIERILNRRNKIEELREKTSN